MSDEHVKNRNTNLHIFQKPKLSDYFKFAEPFKSYNKLDDVYKSSSGREVRILENLLPKSLDSDYIQKVCQLLKKKDKNYSKKRKNITKTTYKFDENNNLYLTLPKFDYGKRIREIINEKIKENRGVSMRASKIVIDEEAEEEKKTNLEALIPEFYQNNYTISDESQNGEFNIITDSDSDVSNLKIEEQKKLFEKLKTKKNFNKHNNTLKQNTNRFKLINNSQSLSNIKLNISNNIFELTSGSAIQNIKKLNEKIKIIRKEKTNEKKEKILAVDLFNYDKKKWHKQGMKETDKILLNIKEFEERRNELFDKMFTIAKVPASTKLKSLKKNNRNIFSDEIAIGII